MQPLEVTSQEQLEALRLCDVMAPKTEEPAPAADEKENVEQKIAQLAKGSTFTMKLSADAIHRLTREASIKSLDWKTYLREEIADRILNSEIGSPLISKPSFAKQLITGPSFLNK